MRHLWRIYESLFGQFVEMFLSMTQRKFFKLLTLLISFGLMATSCSPKEQKDCGFVQNVYGQRISWKSQEPIELVINSSVPASLRPAIYRAVKTWEDQIGQKMFEITEDSSRASQGPSKDGKNAIYFLSSWETERRAEQGRTSVYWADNQIMEADIRINAQNFSFYDQDPQQLILGSGVDGTVHALQNSDGYNFEALVLHELGHFLGLKHTSERSSVMVTHLSAYTDRTVLSASDSESVKCVY